MYKRQVFFLIGCDVSKNEEVVLPPSPDELIEHSKEFKKEVISFYDSIHVAIGYSLANSIMVEANGAKIIIDTTGTIETGREVRSIFDRLNPYPIEAIIYTHNHGDHVFGAKAFIDNEKTEVIAHQTTEKYINRILGILRPNINKRSSRMFGSSFPEETISYCDNADAILKGPIGLSHEASKTIPIDQQPERGALLPMRRRYDTFANFRPVYLPRKLAHFSPLKEEIIGDEWWEEGYSVDNSDDLPQAKTGDESCGHSGCENSVSAFDFRCFTCRNRFCSKHAGSSIECNGCSK